MDPNAILEEMRALADQAASGLNVRRAERELRWKFTELDKWLSTGGFPPDAWRDEPRLPNKYFDLDRPGEDAAP
jgi:hypothetical protein